MKCSILETALIHYYLSLSAQPQSGYSTIEQVSFVVNWPNVSHPYTKPHYLQIIVGLKMSIAAGLHNHNHHWYELI